MIAHLRCFGLASSLLLLSASPLWAAAKSFTVLPFSLNGPPSYKYLEQSTPQMFASRLFWKGQFEPVPQIGAGKPVPADDEAAAAKAQTAANADYVIWGSITIVGDHCSLDIRVRDNAGKIWPKSQETTVKELIPSMRAASDAINAEIFRRPVSSQPKVVPAEPQRVNQMNPDLVHNIDRPKDVYLNPQIRYSGESGDGSRIRSQTLPFASVGMEICDADGDRRNEVFILGEHRLVAYRFERQGTMQQIAEHRFSLTQTGISIRSIDLDFSRRPKLLVVTKSDSDDRPMSYIFSFDGKEFKQEARTTQYYMNVVRIPPDYTPQLIGQAPNPPHLFRPGVFLMNVRGSDIVAGGRIQLPEGCNVFNFSAIPPGRDVTDTAKTLMITEDEHLRLYSEKGTRMFQSEERYSGSEQGIEVDISLPGLGKDPTTEGFGRFYFIPKRMLVVDLDRDGHHEIIVNRPISTASAIFSQYRSFPESEIHALHWDGTGLNLVWKTRRIKGSMVDYTIADATNDGTTSLVACINTHPGPLGTGERKTIVLAYPLDLTKTDPKTAPHASEFEQQ